MDRLGCLNVLGGIHMEAGLTGAPILGQNPAAQDLIGTVSAISNSLMNEVGKVIIGKPQNLRWVTVGILSNGNMLLEDFPGLAKTLLANTFARALGCKFKRVQFTPDLLPSDIMGTYMYDQKSGEFKLRAGPLFSNILLADEINRAPPRRKLHYLKQWKRSKLPSKESRINCLLLSLFWRLKTRSNKKEPILYLKHRWTDS